MLAHQLHEGAFGRPPLLAALRQLIRRAPGGLAAWRRLEPCRRGHGCRRGEVRFAAASGGRAWAYLAGGGHRGVRSTGGLARLGGGRAAHRASAPTANSTTAPPSKVRLPGTSP